MGPWITYSILARTDDVVDMTIAAGMASSSIRVVIPPVRLCVPMSSLHLR